MATVHHKRLKILLGCYACDPNHGSELGCGWNFMRHLAQHFEVHALVEEMECREPLEKRREEHPEEFEHITLHFIRKVRHPLLRKIWPPVYYHFYDKWEKWAYEYAIELDKKENFDIVHHITMCSYRRPGYLWKLGKPFVWGPVGGLNNTAWCLLPGLGLHGMVYFAGRNIFNYFQMRFGRAAKKVAPHTSALYIADPHYMEAVKRYWGLDAKLMSEIGVPKTETFPAIARHEPGTPLRICWAGTMTTLKALNFVLRALPQCHEKMELHVMGRGNKEAEWKALAKRLGVEDQVVFHGFMPHEELLRFMPTCHLLCFSSIKEGGTATVVLESMLNGLPVLAIDHCAFSSVIDDSCGIKVPVQSPAGISRDFARHLDRLATDETWRVSLAEGAHRKSQEYTWETKMEELCRTYEQLASKASQQDRS